MSVKFTDDLAVFRFRAFVTEKARTQKGQVSFENAYNIFDDEARGYVDFKSCEKALSNNDKTITKYDVEIIMRKVRDEGANMAVTDIGKILIMETIAAKTTVASYVLIKMR